MNRGQRAVKTTIAAAMFLPLMAGGAFAQAASGSATSGQLSVGATVGVDTNPNLLPSNPGTQTSIDGTLGFTFGSQTRTQRLDLVGNGSLRFAADPAGSTLTISRPSVGMSYLREAANADFTAGFSLRQTDVTGAYDIDPSATVVLVADDGVLTATRANVGVQVGKQAPFSFGATARIDNNSFAGTLDPLLFDNQTASISANAGFRISPVTQATLNVSFADYSAQDVNTTQTQTTNIGLSVSHDLRRALTIDANVGVQNRDVLSGILPTRNGVFAGVGLTQALPRGSIFARARTDTTGPTSQTALTFGRALTLPAGNLSASVTATDVAGSGIQMSGNASYDQTLVDGAFQVGLSQGLSVNSLDQDILLTRLNVGYNKNVTADSSLAFSFDVSRTEDGGAGAAPTLSRGTLAASYNKTLARDWDMTIGYRHRFATSSIAADADSNSVFLSLTRNLQFNF